MPDSFQTERLPVGYRWRSSKSFTIATISIALFTESLLYGFIVPILSYMLEVRLHLDASQTQRGTTHLLMTYGLVALISAPITAHLADRMPNRRTPLLMALVGCIIGTVLVASTLSLWTVYLGRVLQAIASSSAWIIGFATLADAAGPDQFGQVTGIVLSFAAAGTVSGPTISGILLEFVGYWATWSVPLAVLGLDIIARLLMIQGDLQGSLSSPSSAASTSGPSAPLQDEERARLLPPISKSYPTKVPGESELIPTDIQGSFFRIMLLNRRVLTGLAGCLLYSSLIANFENTIPLHVREIFGWGSVPAGLMFFCLQIPNIILNPISGRIRDRIGVRYPVTIGWALVAPLMWLLGTPGSGLSSWTESHGPAITISCLGGIGALGSLLHGAGPTELAAVAEELESKDPLIFGPNGAGSRVFSLAETAFTLGIMLGPLISGSLSEAVGYYYMNLIFSIMCLVVSVASFCFLGPKGAEVEIE